MPLTHTHTIIKHITANNHLNQSLHIISSTIQTTDWSMNGSHFHRNRDDVTNHSELCLPFKNQRQDHELFLQSTCI